MPFRKKIVIGEIKLGEIASLTVSQQWRASCRQRDSLNGRSRTGGRAC
jgi:hypothetical protein